MVVNVKHTNFSFNSEALIAFYADENKLEIVLNTKETSFFFFFGDSEDKVYRIKFSDVNLCQEAYDDIVKQLKGF